jgi:hypothetical protein
MDGRYWSVGVNQSVRRAALTARGILEYGRDATGWVNDESGYGMVPVEEALCRHTAVDINRLSLKINLRSTPLEAVNNP